MLTLKNVTLIDGTGAPPVENAAVVMENGSVSAAGRGLEAPAGSSVMDLAGCTVMPALIDAHTHFSGSSSFDRPSAGVLQNTYDYDEAREGFLRWGVLTVRTCGDQCPDILTFRDRVRHGKGPLAPRIFAAGPWLQCPGGHPACTVYGSDKQVLDNACILVSDDTDMGAVISKLVGRVDWVKAFYGHLDKTRYPHPAPRMSKRCLEGICQEAHRRGLRVMVHIDGAHEMADAVACGADCIEHIIGTGSDDTEYSDAFIAELAKKQIPVDPTIISIARFEGKVNGAPPVLPALLDTVRRMHEAGVRLCAGCDSGIPFVPFGESLHDELGMLVRAGFSPMEAIRAATAVNASVLGLGAYVGTVLPGRRADLLVLGSDPLENIANTKDIRMVLQRGHIVYDQT